MKCRTAALLALLAIPGPAAAQHDYRNLDHGRPLSTEDAYAIEQGALEVMIPWNVERHAGKTGVVFEPEVMWGILRNAMVGMGAPILLGDDGGLAGLRPFVFYNFNSEGQLPAFALRLDGTAPVGTWGGDELSISGTFIMTKSFGTTRVHLNSSSLLGGTGGLPVEDTPASSSWSIGVDHTLWRQSLVLMADIQRQRFDCYQCEDGPRWSAGLGIRMQATPTLVVDIGMQRRLSPTGPDLAITAGFTRAFAVTGGVE